MFAVRLKSKPGFIHTSSYELKIWGTVHLPHSILLGIDSPSNDLERSMMCFGSR